MKTSRMIASLQALVVSAVTAAFGLGIAGPAHGQATSMFSDPSASDVGDALTVVIQENTTATNQTSTVLEKQNSVQIESTIPGAGNVLDFIPLHTLDSDIQSDFEGTGSTSRSARRVSPSPS